MPARIVVVHDDPDFINALAAKLGPGVAWFNDPIRALWALETAERVAFLVTRVQFADRQPIGLSLARMARATRPEVRVIFTGGPNHREFTRGLGEFIPEPVSVSNVAVVVGWLMEGGGDAMAAN